MEKLYLINAALIFSAGIALYLAWYGWSQGTARASRYFSWLMLAVAEYSLAVAFELSTTDIASKIFWSKVQYVGAVSLAPLWLLVAVSYGQREAWLTRRRVLCLWIIPVLSLVLAWTNEWHHLIWTEVRLLGDRSGHLAEYKHGLPFEVFIAYSYLLILLGSISLIGTALGTTRGHRAEMVVLVLAALAPWAVHALAFARLNPLAGLEHVPLAFAVTGVLLAWGIFRLGMLRSMPIAYEAVLAGMSEGAVILDRDGRVVEVNPAAGRMLGLPPKLTGGRLESRLGERFDPIRHAGETFEVELTSSEPGPGERRWVEGRFGSLFDHRGARIGTLLLSRDITERKRTEDAQRRLDARMLQMRKLESLGIMAGGIAHDFNNMLTAIVGNAELVLLETPESSPATERIHRLIEVGQRAGELCGQMLAYSGKGLFAAVPVNLSEVVDGMLQAIDDSVSREVSLRYSLARDLPLIEADVEQLQQTLLGLVMNAYEALPDGRGDISIRTGVTEIMHSLADESGVHGELRPGLYVFLEVSDSGCGIDRATFDKIFDPFFSTKFPGRGLGLAAARGIALAHRGAIRAQSEPGKGATFSVFFPVSEPEPVSAA